MKINDFNVAFDYRIQSSLLTSDCRVTEKYVQSVNGSIIKTDDYGNEVGTIGTFSADIVLSGLKDLMEPDIVLFDIFDAFDMYLANVGNAIIDEKKEADELKKSVRNLTDFAPARIISLKTIRINPEYRGMKLCYEATYDMLMNFIGPDDLAILKPFPLYENDTDKPSDDEIDKAIEKLRNYYKRMGFRQVRGIKDYMFATLPDITQKVYEMNNKKA